MPLVLLFGFVAWLVLRRRGKGARGPRRDLLTVVSLVTWRPLRRFLPLLAPAWLVLVVGRVAGLLPLAAAAVAVALLWSDVVLLSRQAGRWFVAQCHADRWLKAVVEGEIQGGPRWWFRSPYPVPASARVDDAGNVTLTVAVPPKMSVEQLAKRVDELGAALDAQALVIEPDEAKPMSRATVHVMYRRLEPGRPVEVVAAPDVEQLIRVGDGMAGPQYWDVDAEPGLGVFGGTGSGKGRLARWAALQWLDPRYGRRLLLIDPQGSGEWGIFDGDPRALRLRGSATSPVEALQAMTDALASALRDIEQRVVVCDMNGVDRWADLPADVRVTQPRTLVLVDEVSILLAKVPAGDPTAKLRAQIGGQLAELYRGGRKGGYSPLHVDQASYSDQLYLPPGSVGQLGRWIALGGVRTEHRLMVSGMTDWPYVRPVPGLAVTGRRADLHPQPIEVPNVDRACADRTMREWAAV